MARKMKKPATFLLYVIFLILLTPFHIRLAFAVAPNITLQIIRNESLRDGFTEFLLRPVNNTTEKIAIEYFPSMRSIHVFIVSDDGTTYSSERRFHSKNREFYSRRRFCLFPSAKSGFLFSVAKGNGYNIERPGEYYIVYAIRKPNNEAGFILSPITQFTLSDKHNIVSYSIVSADKLAPIIRHAFYTEVIGTMEREGFSVQKSDIPF